jgi:hypothetical protein
MHRGRGVRLEASIFEETYRGAASHSDSHDRENVCVENQLKFIGMTFPI